MYKCVKERLKQVQRFEHKEYKGEIKLIKRTMYECDSYGNPQYVSHKKLSSPIGKTERKQQHDLNSHHP